MTYLRCILLLIVALTACAGASFAQQAAEGPSKDAAAGNARLDELRAQGSEALYNMDYEEARRIFTLMMREFPDHPAGPHSMAASFWLQTMNESRRLQSSLYATKSFYSKTVDKVDPKLVETFRDYTRQAKQLAEARLQRDPRDTEALYFLGATQGLKAAFAGAVERRFMAALDDGLESVEFHRKVLKLDPTFHDAEVTIGVYNYTAGGLPLAVRLLAKVGGISGSKKRGIETLERVVAQGRRANDDARVMLIALYKREKRYADALRFARELAAKYPRNYLFRLETADALICQAALDRKAAKETAAAETEAFAIYDSLLRDPAVRAARYTDLIQYRYGEALSAVGQHEQAARHFEAAAKSGTENSGLVSMAYLRAAQSFDLMGKRSEAVATYNAVLKRPNVFDMYNEAQRGLRSPYTHKD
jgi:tetratricopeptide (TPR) repeat protein